MHDYDPDLVDQVVLTLDGDIESLYAMCILLSMSAMYNECLEVES